MKALTISQPWASLIADGAKWVENRTWSTTYRGPLAIHAGKGTQYLSPQQLRQVPHGCVIATARLVACVRLEEITNNSLDHHCRRKPIPGSTRTWAEAKQHKYAEGPWCWILEDIIKLETPVAATGKQQLWNWRPST